MMNRRNATATRRNHWLAAAVAALLAFVFVTLAGGCGMPSFNGGNGTLTVGVRADVMGFGYYNEKTHKYYGMEIDLANEMASRMGYSDVKFVTVTPDTRKEMLQDGQVDALVACYSISDHRKENVDFSPSYYTSTVQMMVENSSLITDTNGLKGHYIGTRAGTDTAALLVKKLAEIGFSDGNPLQANDDNSDVRFDNFHLLQYPSYQELSDALESGAVGAIALDSAIAKTYLNDERSTLSDFSINPEEYGVATKKDSALSATVKTTIQNMLDDGTINRFIDKWD